MAQPTPQTLHMFQLLDEDVPEQTILSYLTENQNSIDVNYTNPENNKNILLYAVLKDYTELITKFLELGALINSDTEYELEYHCNITFPNDLTKAIKFMNLIIQAGLSREKMMFLVCSRTNELHTNLLKELLKEPFNVNYLSYGETILIHLINIFYDQTELFFFKKMMSYLIEKGVDPSIKNNENKNTFDVVKRLAFELQEHILEILQKSPHSNTCDQLWMEELKKPESDIAKLEEYKSLCGDTINYDESLQLYLKNTHLKLDIVESLLKWGGDPNKVFYDIPIFFEIVKKDFAIIQSFLPIFIKYGANLNPDKNMNILIYYILSLFDKKLTNDSKNIINFLIEQGADLRYTSKDKKEIISVLISTNTDPSILNLLFEKGAPAIISGQTRIVDLAKKIQGIEHISYFENVLKVLLKYYNNTDDYYRDYLNYVLEFPTGKHKHYMYKILIAYAKLNYNAVYSDGSTHLIKLVKIHEKNKNNIWIKSTIQRAIELGANPKYVDKFGRKAADYTSDEEIKEILGESVFKILWTGFSKSDIDFTNSIFHQKTHNINLTKEFKEESLFSMCPICLKYIEHENMTCMYMSHSCKEQAGYEGYYHKKLWDAFSYKKQYYANGALIPEHLQKMVVEWCTLCGRICKGHRHYKLAPIHTLNEETIHIPEFAGEGDYYATTCAKPGIGGGGIREKINRYRRFREIALALNNPSVIGKITLEKAINTLVEAMWEAPLDPRRFEIQHILEKKHYNEPVANSRFPLPSELPTPPNYIYSSPAYPDIENTDLHPIVIAKATSEMKNSAYNMFGDDENIVQFRHRMADGIINKHDGPNQQIALGRLIGYLQHICDTPNSIDFGMCWQHGHEGYTMVNDRSHMPPKCSAKLYPEEVLLAIQKATYSDEASKKHHMDIYKLYNKRFAERFGKPIGLAPAGNSENENQKGGKQRRTRKRIYLKK